MYHPDIKLGELHIYLMTGHDAWDIGLSEKRWKQQMQKKSHLKKPISINIYPGCLEPTCSFTSREGWLEPPPTNWGMPDPNIPQYFCEFPKDICSHDQIWILHHPLAPSPLSSFCWISAGPDRLTVLLGPHTMATQTWIQPSPYCLPQGTHTRAVCVGKVYRSLLKAFHSNKASNWTSVMRCPCFSKAP